MVSAHPAWVLAALAVAAIPLAADGNAQDGAAAAQMAKLQAEVASLRGQVALLDQRVGLTTDAFAAGTRTTRRIDLRTPYGSIMLDHEGIAIEADKIRINGRAVTLDGSRTLALRGAAVAVSGDSVRVRDAGDMDLKGKPIRDN